MYMRPRRRSIKADAGACRSGRSRASTRRSGLKSICRRSTAPANVIEFTGPTGHWVRIRPAHDDKQRAVEIASKDKFPEGTAYLVRLD